MHDTILVPTDGSSDAKLGAQHAVDLAASLGATVHALYVIRDSTNPWDPRSLEDQLDEAESYGDEVSGEVADMAEEAGVECVTENKVASNVSQAINEYAEEEGMDCIVMGSGYRGSMGDILGSTADKVLRMSTVPVTVLKRSEAS